MKRVAGLSWLLVVGVAVAACGSGSQGEPGTPGAAGGTGKTGPAGSAAPAGSTTPSVSVVTPPYAFQDRTVDVTIAGSGTTWGAGTTVSFSDPKVKVNNVTVASATGLLVNITIAADATLGPLDISIVEGKVTVLYSGAFTIKAPLLVTVQPTAGVPQGGLANLHVQMQDLTTPFDPDTLAVTLSSPDVETSQPSPTDYAFDLTIYADVLGTPGTFDLTTTFGTATTITSPAAQSFKLAARAPTTLTASAAATGNIQTELDTELYEFTPASAAQEFIQFTTSSQEGTLSGTVIPKSGKYADALVTGFAYRFAQGITSTAPYYVVVGDSDGLFGAGPTPADTSLAVFESPCTSVNETSETATANNDTFATAQAVSTLPALVNGALGYGSVDGAVDVDVYAITVLDTATKIHVATGGDPYDDTIVAILDSTGAKLKTSDDLDYQEDLVFDVTGGGTYYVTVAATPSGNFSDSDNTYQLFIAVQ
jgi:hypothetical protein